MPAPGHSAQPVLAEALLSPVRHLDKLLLSAGARIAACSVCSGRPLCERSSGIWGGLRAPSLHCHETPSRGWDGQENPGPRVKMRVRVY